MFSIAEVPGRLTLLAGSFMLLVGCATGPTQYQARTLSAEQEQVVASKPPALQPLYRELFQEGRRNEVLNLMEIGATAFRLGHYDLARVALDQTILNIESVYADSDAARQARSLWYEEGAKDFKGEPYERTMAYFYRGLLYLQSGEYGNARASFLSGLLQDAFAEEEQFSADFASMVFLAGWAARLDGNEKLAREHFEEYRSFRPDSPLPEKGHNVLVIAETGTAPRKLADGVGHYELVYRRGKQFSAYRARVADADMYPFEDVFFQASTRGGRTVDRIIEGKVNFKQATSGIGDGLTSVARNDVLAGLGASAGGSVAAGFHAITAIGVAAQGLSAQAKTRADTRYWEALPDTLHVYTLKAKPGSGPLQILFKDQSSAPLPALTRQAQPQFDQHGYGLVFASSRTE